MAKRLRPPLRYFGGKGNMVAKLLPLFPEHRIYVEPFGGGASLLFAKEPSPVEVYNDLDERVVNFFRVLRDSKKAQQFIEMVQLTPYSRKEWLDARDHVFSRQGDDVERAWAYFVMMKQGFSGFIGQSWSMAVANSCRGVAGTVSRWLSTIEHLLEVVQRLRMVQIERNDWRKVLKQYDRPGTFFYLDPPYVPETRSKGGYAHEMTRKDHEELVQVLLRIEGRAMLSGYPNDVYAPLEEAGWTRKEWKTACSAAAKTRMNKLQGKGAAMRKVARTEVVWMNYDITTGEKIDYSFLE